MADNNSQSQQPHAQGGGGGGGGGHHRQLQGRRPPIHPMRFAALSKITQRSMVARYSPTQKSLERNLRARLGHASVFGAVAAATAAATTTTTADNNSSDDDAGNENINENSGRMVAGRAFKDLDSIWRIPLPAMTLPLKAPQHHKVIGSLDTLSNGTTVLEQGIIHFGIQGPLGAPKHRFDPCKVWSYLVIGPDNGEPNNVRLLAFNKMVPTDSGRDPWLGFVKDTGVSIEQVKQQFLQTSNSYKKVSMLGDGFYTITNTGQDTQFSYMFARPEVLDSDDRDDVAFVKGSWIMSIQSPHYARFNYATLREPVPFSKETLDEFGDQRWKGMKPNDLVPKAELLIIGEPTPCAEDREKPYAKDNWRKLEKLEPEIKRMQHLGKDDTEIVFADLEARVKNHPKLKGRDIKITVL